MKLRNRLLTGFIVVAFMSMIVGFLAIRNMGVMNAGSKKMYQNELLGLSLIKQANIHLLYTARAEKNYLLASTEAQRDKYYTDWKKNLELTKSFTDQASGKFYTEAGKQAIANINLAYNDWVPVTTQVMELEKNSSLAKQNDAVDLSIGKAREKVNALEAAIDDATTRKDKNAQQLAATAESVYNSSILLMIVIIIFAMLLGIGIGIVLSLSVQKTVGGEPSDIAQLTDKVATGDLTIDTSHMNKTTGIYHSLLSMIQKLQDIVVNIQTSASQVSDGSQQLSSSAQTISQGATEQASSVEEISASMEEMSSNIRQNAENAQMTEKIAQKIGRKRRRGRQGHDTDNRRNEADCRKDQHHRRNSAIDQYAGIECLHRSGARR